jgi:hypothetical protein
VTAADDELLRLWNSAGKKVAEYAYKGGSCRCVCSRQLMSFACICHPKVASGATILLAGSISDTDRTAGSWLNKCPTDRLHQTAGHFINCMLLLLALLQPVHVAQVPIC